MKQLQVQRANSACLAGTSIDNHSIPVSVADYFAEVTGKPVDSRGTSGHSMEDNCATANSDNQSFPSGDNGCVAAGDTGVAGGGSNLSATRKKRSNCDATAPSAGAAAVVEKTVGAQKVLVCGLSPRLFGTLICLLGVLWLSPDTLLVRIVQEGGANIWAVAFWRMVFFFGFALLAQLAVRGPRLDRAFRQSGWVGIMAGLMWGIGTNCFTVSLSYTKVANTLVIFASNPLWTALFSWLFLKERIPRHTAIAIVFGFGGIAVVLGGVISKPEVSIPLLGSPFASRRLNRYNAG